MISAPTTHNYKASFATARNRQKAKGYHNEVMVWLVNQYVVTKRAAQPRKGCVVHQNGSSGIVSECVCVHACGMHRFIENLLKHIPHRVGEVRQYIRIRKHRQARHGAFSAIALQKLVQCFTSIFLVNELLHSQNGFW